MALLTNSNTYAGCIELLARRFGAGMGRAEALLWAELKGRRLMGYRFERRRQVDRYVVDFYCRDLHLAVDIVGNRTPWPDPCMDEERAIRLRLSGLRYLVFSEEEILHNLDGVLSRIRQAIRSLPWK